MHLLKLNDVGEFCLTQNFVDNIPKYAILSHTWGPDGEEVTFGDLIGGTGRSKVGFQKIRFCGEQAERDGLQYFWVDTCCIDKTNSTELAEAINSMFRWYRNATKCYAYLSDVSRSGPDTVDEPHQVRWKSSFRRSRWFTRGWTLQELIAPTSVEFFSKDWELLGDKASLEQSICEITGIPIKALRRPSLSDFSITERLSWARNRQTTCEEDSAYSLLGIFNVYMPLIYGEGKEIALKRLREEIDKSLKGTMREDFSVAFSLSNVSDIECFVAREEELADIHRFLSSDGSRRIVALQGLGGIGKTQISIAYAKRHKDDYSAILWLNIKDQDSLRQSFAGIARQIIREHPLANQLSNIDIKGDLDTVVDAVKAWLSLPNNTRWLMIYDNYDNPKFPGNTDIAAIDIRKFLPESYQGSVIITTRSLRVGIGHIIQIHKLGSLRDSLQVLFNASRREGLMNDPNAIKLAKKLDGLPLALATAGSYLHQVAMSVSSYLRLYEESWAKLQQTSPELSSYEDRTLYSTWQVSYDHVKQQNILSANLLCLWAYFDNEDLWLELLQHCDSDSPDWINELTKDKLNFHSAVRVLSDHGLVEVHKSSQEMIESPGYSMHGCVHLWTVHVLNQEWNSDLARVAVKLVGSHVPTSNDIRPWITQRRLLQHAAKCSDVLLKGLIIEDDTERACNNLGNLYSDQGKLTEAEEMYQRALKGYEKALGPEHISTLDTVNNLGILYNDQGKLTEAEEMYQRALKGHEKALGPEHISTLDTINNLGTLYRDQGKLTEAEEMYQQALKGYEKALGPEHISTLRTVNNLGILYRDQGKLTAAEEMYQRALKGREKALGPEHISTLNTVNNLGDLYRGQEKLIEAEEMYQRALNGYEKALGAEHNTLPKLNTIFNLGVLYEEQGKPEEAEGMYRRALKGYENILDYSHSTCCNVRQIIESLQDH